MVIIKKIFVCGAVSVLFLGVAPNAVAQSSDDVVTDIIGAVMEDEAQIEGSELDLRGARNALNPLRVNSVGVTAATTSGSLGSLRRRLVEGYYSKRVESTKCADITTVRNRNMKYIQIEPKC